MWMATRKLKRYLVLLGSELISANTQTHRHTDTQTHRHTDTDTDTDTQMNRTRHGSKFKTTQTSKLACTQSRKDTNSNLYQNDEQWKAFEFIKSGTYIYEGLKDCVFIVTADINECSTGAKKCNRHADCINTVGSYICKCKRGYKGDGARCTGEHNKTKKEQKYPRTWTQTRRETKLTACLKYLIILFNLKVSRLMQPQCVI